jgi:hypothetical protein
MFISLSDLNPSPITDFRNPPRVPPIAVSIGCVAEAVDNRGDISQEEECEPLLSMAVA